MKKQQLNEIKKLIKAYFIDAPCGVRSYPTWTDNPTKVIYIAKNDGVWVGLNKIYGYFDVRGISEKDLNELKEYYNSLKREMYKNKDITWRLYRDENL